MNIDNTVSFASLGLDNAQLTNYLQTLNVDSATIQKVLNDPSMKILDVVQGDQAKVFEKYLPPPGNGDNKIPRKLVVNLEQLILALLELQAKQNELEQMQLKNALVSNKATMDTSKESNKLTAKAEQLNAIATIIGGAVQVGASAVAYRTVSPKAPKTGVTAETVGNSSTAAQKAMTFNSLGQASSGLISGGMSIYTAEVSKDAKNKASEAEYIKANSESIRSSIAAFQKLMESAQSSVGSINNMMSAVARY